LLEGLLTGDARDRFGRPPRIVECCTHLLRRSATRQDQVLIPPRPSSVASVECGEHPSVDVHDVGSHVACSPSLARRGSVQLPRRTPLETGSKPPRDAGVTFRNVGHTRGSYVPPTGTADVRMIATVTAPEPLDADKQRIRYTGALNSFSPECHGREVCLLRLTDDQWLSPARR
jgi:hypothetical protein